MAMERWFGSLSIGRDIREGKGERGMGVYIVTANRTGPFGEWEVS